MSYEHWAPVLRQSQCCFVMASKTWKKLFRPQALEIAFAGRSNVGKSTLINSLTGVSIAKTSKTPGRTQTLNLFYWGKQLSIMDLPGYGFARAGQAVRQSWRSLIEGYFLSRENLRCVYLLIDSRHLPKESDIQCLTWFRYYGIPYQLIFTKCDKSSEAQRQESKAFLQERVGSEGDILQVSSLKNQGLKDLYRHIAHLLEGLQEDLKENVAPTCGEKDPKQPTSPEGENFSKAEPRKQGRQKGFKQAENGVKAPSRKLPKPSKASASRGQSGASGRKSEAPMNPKTLREGARAFFERQRKRYPLEARNLSNGPRKAKSHYHPKKGVTYKRKGGK